MKSIIEKSYRPEILYNYIERFTIYNTKNLNEIHLLPLGCIQILFQFDESISHYTSFTNKWEKRPTSFLAGPFNKSYLLKTDSETKIFSVELKLGKAQYFFKNSIYDFRNHLLPLDTIWPKTGKKLLSQFYNSKSDIERCRIIERFLIKQFLNSNTSKIEPAIDLTLSKSGIVNINELSSISGLSTSQFRKQFKKEVGLSPKEFQKIIRLNALQKYKANNKDTSLTELAYRFKYADQSHFIKDFKSISNVSPSRFLL